MLHTYLYYTAYYRRNPCRKKRLLFSFSFAIQDYFISADSALTGNNNTEEDDEEEAAAEA